MNLEEFSEELVELIERGVVSDRHSLNAWKARLAKKHALDSMPSNPDILSACGRVSEKVHSLLCKKPVRSMSGVVVVAAMVPPHECPGKCIYCPSSQVDTGTPKSYTGREPATMRAIQAGFDAGIQVRERLRQLAESGHSLSKAEFIVMGGTLFSQSRAFREKFMLSALNAFTDRKAKSIEAARRYAEHSKTRIVGITFETRPDYCSRRDVSSMLFYGGTRCELGVQVLSDSAYKRIKRGHTVNDVAIATANLRNAGFKVLYHTMPGLPGVSLKEDLASFKKMFEDERFKPDMLKIYPCLVIKGTGLYKEFLKGNYAPLDEKKAVKLILRVKEIVPRWVRIMRIQRDIPSQLIEAGVKKSNLRQLVEMEMQKQGKKCKCIRCREAALKSYKTGQLFDAGKARLFIEEYAASGGVERFISLEDKKRQALFGYCRLRVPEHSYRKEIGSSAAIVRELRVFGEPLLLGERKEKALQHHGLGARLFLEAERVSRSEFGRKKLVVIAGLGVREYYRKMFGCRTDGLYVSKSL